ncbi:MAG: tryptophan synthase subunit alpha [Coriobacteriia bacterium]|nr:tryptophan synthase subunit alpha [Coriobacteriia bacterium]
MPTDAAEARRAGGAGAPGGLRRGFPAGRAALVTYLMAGYPDRERSLAALRAAAAAGADVVEIGVPFSDPLADGPVIQQAAEEARRAAGGPFGLAETIALAAEFLGEEGCDGPPVALMTYLNPMLRLGLAETARRAVAAGVSGFIVPDMPFDAAGMWLEAAEGLDTVLLAAPTSTPERLARIGAESSGFVYCVSSLGVTGERSELSEELAGYVRRVKAATDLPVAVGFGVGTPDQACAVARVADGVVVGSAIVRLQEDAAAVAAFVGSLAEAVRGARQRCP